MQVEQITKAGSALRVLAPAKINLSLLVAGKRPDGFHELETIMAKVSLYDELLIEPGDKSGIELICRGPEWAPDGQENLVYQACQALLDACGMAVDLRITLTKNIPAGAGLGGASSDAAATLIGVNEYLQLGLKTRDLGELAAKLGSDVSFFLDGPLALCTGRGEKIEKKQNIFEFTAVLLLPAVNVSTKKVYASYRHDANIYEQLNGQIDSALAKNRIALAADMCANMLVPSSFGLYPELRRLKAQVESLGIEPLCLSGSGSAMYHIVKKADGGRGPHILREIYAQTGCKCIIITNNRW